MNFVITGYRAYNRATKPYNSDLIKDNSGWKLYNDSKPTSPIPVPSILILIISVSLRSVSYSFSSLKFNLEVPVIEIKAIKAFYSEGSSPNKRLYIKEILEPIQN